MQIDFNVFILLEELKLIQGSLKLEVLHSYCIDSCLSINLHRLYFLSYLNQLVNLFMNLGSLGVLWNTFLFRLKVHQSLEVIFEFIWGLETLENVVARFKILHIAKDRAFIRWTRHKFALLVPLADHRFKLIKPDIENFGVLVAEGAKLSGDLA